MIFYDGTKLKMRRGDSDSMEVKGMSLTHGDILYFTVKNHIFTDGKILQIKVDEFNEIGDAVIEVKPKDTKRLMPRKYIYDIQVNLQDGQVITIIPPSEFNLEGDVTIE